MAQDHRNAETDGRVAADMDAADRARRLFLAKLSHDIRTPLNGVLGMAQAMAADELTEAQRARLETLRRSGEALLVILNDVVGVSNVEPAIAEVSPPAASSDRPLRILAAEDNAVNQVVLRALLEQAGIEPFIVDDGAAAVDAWQAGAWDVILMDVQMPIMDGPSATRAIRAAERTSGRRRTPIVALTAGAMAHQVAEYAAAGMDGFIAKPIRVEALFSGLEAALELAEAGVAA
ncbi:response regulator [Phenylobacterium sp.]|uniref:response regulator n=1 Tax=Phenylobacterium sp. TaxID=1871053 RepID=UPI0025D3AF1F|nr:response regulator [Phenylobacterium sp.]